MEDAMYIPPSPFQMQQSLNNLEKYFHINDKDILVQTAIIHAQFEIIHPFLDGNGRIGRLLIPLFMYSKGLLSYPSFYMSEYFSLEKEKYYTHLHGISENGNWNNWIVFFLDAVIKQAKINLSKVQQIIQLYEKIKELIQKEVHTHHFIDITDFIFCKPAFKASEFAK
jgi:Fic family protein